MSKKERERKKGVGRFFIIYNCGGKIKAHSNSGLVRRLVRSRTGSSYWSMVMQGFL
jgi:hypothetical protein